MAETFSVGDRVRLKESAPPLFDKAVDRRAAVRLVEARRIGVVTQVMADKCSVQFERSRLGWQVSSHCLVPADTPAAALSPTEADQP